ncbi:hypothetical protein POM88_012421 [Heracleum sosnowskyi]|uniref:Cytochrome P450 n=1 Tax=Heracleum sosnowskyi TaxID=360622 RepID=A0AAD8IWR8_9APIA|nr:hypothetical protein POM88_012421 [Heracleum sosnowskyi]
MASTVLKIAVTTAVVAATTVLWRVLNWVWLRPKNFEKHLRKQGFNGNSYRILSMLMATRSNPIPISHDVPPRFSASWSATMVCAIKAPGFRENRKSNLQDLAVLTGGQLDVEWIA